MSKKNKKWLILIITLTLIISFNIPSMALDNPEKFSGASNVQPLIELSYSSYLSQFADKEYKKDIIEISSKNIIHDESFGIKKSDNGIITDEKSTATFDFEVFAEGLYQIKITYTTIEGKGSSIERQIRIDGETPYPELKSIALSRTFKDSDIGITIDSRGNEYRPEQVEVYKKSEISLVESQGYISGPLFIFLSKGSHKISLDSIREPVIINNIVFCGTEAIPTYNDVLGTYETQGYKKASENSSIIMEAENASFKSSSTLYPINDRTSSLTSPNDVGKVVLNTIGGYNWRYQNQSMTWNVGVEESGLYELCMRYKQNFIDGQSSVRSLLINGKIPFKEVENIEFKFSNDWQLKTIGESESYLFYFEAGKSYDITLKNTLGDYSKILSQAQKSILDLNEVYRQIKMIVGSTADLNRDYSIDKQLPSCMESLSIQTGTLKTLADITEKLTGSKGDGYAAYQRLFIQIDSFLSDPDTIPTRLDSFSTNISSLADYVLRASEQPLTLDYILVNSPLKEHPRVKDTVLEKFVFEMKSFITSFVSDYNLVGTSEGTTRNIDLWLTSGRDQAEVVKQLIDGGFSRITGIGVNVRLVTADVVLPATASGKGPDVAIGQEKSLPVKYGLRNALYDLSKFEDLKSVLGDFAESAYAPFYVGKSLYALPDSQNYLLMYVRTDILKELNLSVPATWSDLYSMIFDLHQNNLDIGLPNITEDNLDIFYALLFQHGASLFSDDLSKTRLDEQKAIDAFEEWSRLYTKYKITEQMNHLTRFRTGEAPLVISTVSFYNTLSISAPEIKGLWKVAKIPGIKSDDDIINNSIGSNPTGAVIFKNVKDPEACWEFLKWWTSDSTQTNYSREMENVQGASGRVITANLKAFSKLSWPVDDLNVMEDQRKSIVNINEIAGSYVLERYLCTALRYTIQKGGNPREILLDWNKKINIENLIRRKEFGF